MRRRAAAVLVATLALLATLAPLRALAFTASAGDAELKAIEARATALAQAPQRDRKALADLDRRASTLAEDASRALAAMREEAAERDADMTAVVASREWQAIEALLLKLRFRIAALQLERALAGDPDKARLAHEAAAGFATFAEAPDPTVAAEGKYGRGLARIAGGDRAAGLADLRAAAGASAVAPRARLALAEQLAEGGERGQALDLVTKQIAAGSLAKDLALRAKLLRLQLVVATRKKQDAAPPGIAPQVGDLLAAGEPWRGAALAALQGNEDLLPSGPGADALSVRLRADAAARRDDAAGALALYRQALQTSPDDRAALEGVARSALATGEWSEARAAVARLDRPNEARSRELALIDLRASYGAWQAAPDAETAAALAAAADAVGRARGATADDRAEAAFRRAEAARADGDLDAAIAAFAAIDAPAWRAAAGTGALQSRVLRWAREPEREPREALLRDLEAWLERKDLPDDACATAVVLDATVRTTPPPPSAPSPPLAAAGQRAALVRLREFPRRHPDASQLLPAVLRARALLEAELGEAPAPALLDALPAAERPAVAAAIAGDLRDELAATSVPGDDVARKRARLTLDGALAFAALAPPAERAKGRLDLAQSALALGDPATALGLFRAEAEAKPTSLRALRGVALAAQATGDEAGARAAWQRLASLPDLPPALRDEAAQALAPAPAAASAPR